MKTTISSKSLLTFVFTESNFKLSLIHTLITKSFSSKPHKNYEIIHNLNTIQFNCNFHPCGRPANQALRYIHTHAVSISTVTWRKALNCLTLWLWQKCRLSHKRNYFIIHLSANAKAMSSFILHLYVCVCVYDTACRSCKQRQLPYKKWQDAPTKKCTELY